MENPEEKQVIFENTHEPIIDLATWERVQELRKQRKRPNRYDEVGLFSGLLFCADCGASSISRDTRTKPENRIATSAATTRSVPTIAPHILSAPTF